jgi:hypothetical protein
MKSYYYLVFTPESLIASHLSPYEFGNYLSVGSKKRLRGQNIFFELDPDKLPDLPNDYIREKLIVSTDGQPKHSVYFGIYRVLERVKLAALKNLYLATDDGKVLELKSSEFEQVESEEIHLYQQFNPITTRVASKLSPDEFIQFLTDTSKPVSTPKLFFAELLLNDLANNVNAPLSNLPYRNPNHLRECLIKLNESKSKLTKTVLRNLTGDIPFRTIKSGFFIGEGDRYLYYAFPTSEEMEEKHHSWWRSALTQHF